MWGSAALRERYKTDSDVLSLHPPQSFPCLPGDWSLRYIPPGVVSVLVSPRVPGSQSCPLPAVAVPQAGVESRLPGPQGLPVSYEAVLF